MNFNNLLEKWGNVLTLYLWVMNNFRSTLWPTIFITHIEFDVGVAAFGDPKIRFLTNDIFRIFSLSLHLS